MNICIFYCLTVCPSDWKQFGSNCYKYFNNQMDWNTADDFCKARLGHLVSIHSEKEMTFLKDDVIQNATLHAWIGSLKSKWPANNWKWTDGSAYDYFNWLNTQPNDLGSPLCGYMNRNHGFKWADTKCSQKFPIICKKKFFN